MGYISKGKGAIGRHGFKSIIGVYNKGSSVIPPEKAFFRTGGPNVGTLNALAAQYPLEGGGSLGIPLTENAGSNTHQFSLSASNISTTSPVLSINGSGVLRSANYPTTVVDPIEVGNFIIQTDDPDMAAIDAAPGEVVHEVEGVPQAAAGGEIGHQQPFRSITLDYAAIDEGASPTVTVTYVGGQEGNTAQAVFTIIFVP
ncbi:MAG: hypothetical protein CMB45_05430 [Euryarchaeota archaeon]|nr:hypothetical protein [Euryarchaeota archaeon]MBK38415.1 hypothetical protein [Euryarchaeota archaeon]|tara:strand:- start:8902 stop:9501 length:600 start_codon:yes stop_codon:yes gene_type:complete